MRRILHMLGIVIVAVAGVVAWKYRDSIAEYVKGNTAPARQRVDELLGTAQQKSEALLDQAKEQISSGLGSARERLKAGESNPPGRSPTE
jgi:hypothetical protein